MTDETEFNALELRAIEFCKTWGGRSDHARMMAAFASLELERLTKHRDILACALLLANGHRGGEA